MTNADSTEMETKQSHEDLRTLLNILPPSIAETVEAAGHEEGLLEIVMDLGRVPTARYVDLSLIHI